MNPTLSRRRLLQSAGLGLAAIGTAHLTLRCRAEPTYSSGAAGDVPEVIRNSTLAIPPAPATLPSSAKPTGDNILGPYHRPGAPFRAKVTPPREPGDVLVVRGRVWGYDRKKPLPFATLDIWQADHAGRYDNDDDDHPPANGVFRLRARLVTDETGYYEYETIRPGRYRIGSNLWRPSHVHYLVRAKGYEELVTQMYFTGDPMNESDQFIKKSLIITPTTVGKGERAFEAATFDIVLGLSR